MNNLYLLARIDGARVAISSDTVESVVRVQDVIPVPRSDPSVAGLFALRSRVLTLIDTQYFVTGKCRPVDTQALAIVAEIAGYHYGLLVDLVEDAVAIDIDRAERNISPSPNWAGIATGLIEIGGEITMVIDLNQIVGAQTAIAA